MNQTSTRRAGAGVAVGALVTSALLFAPSAQAATTGVLESQIAKSGSSASGWYQNGTAGTFKIVNAGLELTGGAQVLKGNADGASDLDDLGTATVAATGGTAPFQVQLTDAEAITDGPATLRPSTVADQWQADKAIGTIAAGTPTTIDAIKTQVGTNYTITAFGVASTGTPVVSNIVFDGTTYLFANNAPVAKEQSLSTKLNTPVSFTLAATDVDGNALTYKVASVVGGAVSGEGTTQTFTPTKNFRGSASVKYTVDDGRGGSATLTVTIQVEKQRGKVEIYRIHPSGKVTVRNTISLYATVKVEGKSAAQGTTVYGYAKGKKVVTGKVNSHGKVKLTLPVKLPAGKSTLKVTQVGSSKLVGDSDTIKVRVSK